MPLVMEVDIPCVMVSLMEGGVATEEALRGEIDLAFLKSSFHKLLLNCTWWVNRKNRFGKNIFEGGCLGLDNISVFDRSAPLPTGGYLEQADGTAWMARFCQTMGEMAVELAAHDATYATLVEKFLDHFLWIAAGMNRPGWVWHQLPDRLDRIGGDGHPALRCAGAPAHPGSGQIGCLWP
jgi:hypothetical protein